MSPRTHPIALAAGARAVTAGPGTTGVPPRRGADHPRFLSTEYCSTVLRVDIDQISRSLTDLAQRVAALEAATPARAQPQSETPVAEQLVHHLAGRETAGDTLLYAGVGGWDGQTLAWQVERSWEEIRSGSAEQSASVLTALGNPTRVRIAVELLRRRLTTAELGTRLDQPSSGQLFHHLKELLAAGVIHQPVRGTYAVREQHVIPLLAVLCAVMDLRPSVPWEES